MKHQIHVHLCKYYSVQNRSMAGSHQDWKAEGWKFHPCTESNPSYVYWLCMCTGLTQGHNHHWWHLLDCKHKPCCRFIYSAVREQHIHTKLQYDSYSPSCMWSSVYIIATSVATYITQNIPWVTSRFIEIAHLAWMFVLCDHLVTCKCTVNYIHMCIHAVSSCAIHHSPNSFALACFPIESS